MDYIKFGSKNDETGIVEFTGSGKNSGGFKSYDNKQKRWEFIGSRPDNSILKKYKNRLLIEDLKPLKAQQNGFRYIN